MMQIDSIGSRVTWDAFTSEPCAAWLIPTVLRFKHGFVIWPISSSVQRVHPIHSSGEPNSGNVWLAMILFPQDHHEMPPPAYANVS